jgi:hypothetical protein
VSSPEETAAVAPSGLSRRLARAPAVVFVGYTAAVAFATYFCMYAFRKPFDATTLTGRYFLGSGIELKTACVIGQLVGYMLSKYLGARVCAEVAPARRAWLLVGLVLVAQAALVGFALAPPAVKPVAMFVNGLPLGMVWGLVVRYLEGRRSSEVLLVALCCSFIIAGAMTRDVGRWLMTEVGITEAWMPAVTGLLFLPAFLASVWLLDRVPAPTEADVAARTVRPPMTAQGRRAFLRRFGLGFVLLLGAYFVLTAFRDFRDHYAIELFTALGLADQGGIFTQTEQWAMLGVVLALALLNLVRNHRRAIAAVYGVVVAGFALVAAATLAFQAGRIGALAWMALNGVGLYLAYVPFNALLFERLVAAARFPGTSVFAIQLADGVGYTGSVLVQLTRDLLFGHLDRLAFFQPFAYVVSVSGIGLMVASYAGVLPRLGSPEPIPSHPAESLP